MSGLKGEIKSLVMVFKPAFLEETYEYALYMESASECQLRKFKCSTKFTLGHDTNSFKPAPDKFNSITPKTIPTTNTPKQTFILNVKTVIFLVTNVRLSSRC
jgi:hypothetical protein